MDIIAQELETQSAVGVELAKWVRLADLGIWPFVPPWRWDYKLMSPCLAFHVGSEDGTQVHMPKYFAK